MEEISGEWLDPKRVRNYVSSIKRIYMLDYWNFSAKLIADLNRNYTGREATVLDLGCGPALFSIDVKRKGPQCRVVAVDPSPIMLEIAQDEAASKGVDDIHFKEGYDGCIPMRMVL